MKLAISNIAWTTDHDKEMYGRLKQYGFDGLEIAPTRIFPEKPYEHNEEAKAFAEKLWQEYGLTIPSMQSIWFGQTDNIFAGKEARERLIAYTKQAILFAEAINCKNLVFGCPRNRNMPETLTKTEQLNYYGQAVDFFTQLAIYAAEHNTVLSMEANPPIYNTNFINGTTDAYDIVHTVNHPGFQINLDLGTMIHNQEDTKSIDLEHILPYVNHIHISEPGLAPITRHPLHETLRDTLRDFDYQKFVSIEMGKQDDISKVDECIQYVLQLMGR